MNIQINGYVPNVIVADIERAKRVTDLIYLERPEPMDEKHKAFAVTDIHSPHCGEWRKFDGKYRKVED
jgi:hypothetical protein